MKLYVYIRTSNGEEAAALDIIKIFTNEKDAKDLFDKDYKDVKSSLKDYEWIDDYKYSNQWDLEVEDDDSPSSVTTFRGFIEIQNID